MGTWDTRVCACCTRRPCERTCVNAGTDWGREPVQVCPCSARVCASPCVPVCLQSHAPLLPTTPLSPRVAFVAQSRQRVHGGLCQGPPDTLLALRPLPEREPRSSYSPPRPQPDSPAKMPPHPGAPLTSQDAGRHGVQPPAQGGPPRQLQQRQQQHGGDQADPEEGSPHPLPSSLHPRAGRGGQEGGNP